MNKQVALSDYVRDHLQSPFVWGENDCCTFGANWVELVTGVNPMKKEKIYKKYKTALGAERMIKKVKGMERVVDKYLDEVPIAFAQVGDIVCGDAGNGPTIGICVGIDSVFLGADRVTYIRTVKLDRAWRV